jgi:hypothetical protein
LPRRYFRLSLVLSFRSSFQGGGVSLQHHGAMHLVAQVLDFRVVSGHVRSSRLSAGAGLNGLGLVFAPALPADREAAALQGRAERAGACDKPLPARPALAVAIPLSFAFTRRLGGVGANKHLADVEGFVAQRPPTNRRR